LQILRYVERTGQNTANKVYFLIGLSTDQKANSLPSLILSASAISLFACPAAIHLNTESSRSVI